VKNYNKNKFMRVCCQCEKLKCEAFLCRALVARGSAHRQIAARRLNLSEWVRRIENSSESPRLPSFVCVNYAAIPYLGKRRFFVLKPDFEKLYINLYYMIKFNGIAEKP